MYVNKCSKCGRDFETKNPKRVICPNCLYPDRAGGSAAPSAESSPPMPSYTQGARQSVETGQADQPNYLNRSPGERSSYGQRQGGGGARGGYDRGGGGRPGGYDRGGGGRPGGGRPGGGRPQGGGRGGYDRGGGGRPGGGGRGGYDRGGGRSQGGGRGGYDRGGGRPGGGRPGGGYDRGGGGRPGGGRPGGGYDRGGRPGGRPGGGRDFRGGGRPGGGRDFRGGGRPGGGRDFRGGRPGGRPGGRGGDDSKLLVTRDQLAKIEDLYKPMLPLPNPDVHEVIGAEIELEPRKVFFGINLIRQKMRLPKLPFPKRRLAVSVDQLQAVETLYEPLLPLPPIGCHKIIAKQLKMDEWRVHVAIGIIRKQMELPRWNPDRDDAPEEFKLQRQQELAAAKEAADSAEDDGAEEE